MKTFDQIIERGTQCLDGRDFTRLTQFLSVEQIEKLGYTFKTPEARAEHIPKPYNRANVLEQLRGDVEFGFEKALNRRGISAGLMYEVVRTWNWVLEEGLEDFDSYAQYGLPLFKATAVKYGFDNPIGDDDGNEYKYSSDAECL